LSGHGLICVRCEVNSILSLQNESQIAEVFTLKRRNSYT